MHPLRSNRREEFEPNKLEVTFKALVYRLDCLFLLVFLSSYHHHHHWAASAMVR